MLFQLHGAAHPVQFSGDVSDGSADRYGLAGREIEDSFREFLKEGREQGNLSPDISDDAVMTYLQFFQQGISGNPALRERLAREPKLSRDLLTLFIYGVHGQSYGATAKNNLEVPG